MLTENLSVGLDFEQKSLKRKQPEHMSRREVSRLTIITYFSAVKGKIVQAASFYLSGRRHKVIAMEWNTCNSPKAEENKQGSSLSSNMAALRKLPVLFWKVTMSFHVPWKAEKRGKNSCQWLIKRTSCMAPTMEIGALTSCRFSISIGISKRCLLSHPLNRDSKFTGSNNSAVRKSKQMTCNGASPHLIEESCTSEL